MSSIAIASVVAAIPLIANCFGFCIILRRSVFQL